MTDANTDWIDARRETHAAATEGPWMQDDVERDKILAPDEPGGWDGYLIAEVTDHDGGLFPVDHNGAAIIDAVNNIPRALDALEAVLRVHTRNRFGECPRCGHDSQGNAIEYPCLTVQAIQAAISSE